MQQISRVTSSGSYCCVSELVCVFHDTICKPMQPEALQRHRTGLMPIAGGQPAAQSRASTTARGSTSPALSQAKPRGQFSPSDRLLSHQRAASSSPAPVTSRNNGVSTPPQPQTQPHPPPQPAGISSQSYPEYLKASIKVQPILISTMTTDHSHRVHDLKD